MQGVTAANIFSLLYIQLAIVTFCGLAVVSKRVAELKIDRPPANMSVCFFHITRRDAADTVRQQSRNRQPSFIIQAENSTAVSILSTVGQASTYVGCKVKDAFPPWLYRQLIDEYTTCLTSQRTRRYKVFNPDGTRAHGSIATPVLDPRRNCVTHIVVTMRDIDEQRAQEQAIAAALRRLRWLIEEVRVSRPR